MVNPISLVSVRNAERLEKTFSRYYVRSTVVNLGDLKPDYQFMGRLGIFSRN
jgi:hypothetical protein